MITRNKTLVAQLYGEFKQFFPDNAVGYFVSVLRLLPAEDLYAPVSNTTIEKDLSINDELDKLRLQATAQLLSGRRDIIIVASVSLFMVWVIPPITRMASSTCHNAARSFPGRGFLHALVNSLYNRSEGDFTRGTFRSKGDTVDINLPYVDFGCRISFLRRRD